MTVSFLTLAFAQLWHVFNMRDKNSGFFNNAIVRNPFVWGALVLCSLLLAATVYVPLLAEVLNVANPGAKRLAADIYHEPAADGCGADRVGVMKGKGKM